MISNHLGGEVAAATGFDGESVDLSRTNDTVAVQCGLDVSDQDGKGFAKMPRGILQDGGFTAAWRTDDVADEKTPFTESAAVFGGDMVVLFTCGNVQLLLHVVVTGDERPGAT